MYAQYFERHVTDFRKIPYGLPDARVSEGLTRKSGSGVENVRIYIVKQSFAVYIYTRARICTDMYRLCIRNTRVKGSAGIRF